MKFLVCLIALVAYSSAAFLPIPEEGAQHFPLPMPEDGVQILPSPIPEDGVQILPSPIPEDGVQILPSPIPEDGVQILPLPIPEEGAQHFPLPIPDDGSISVVAESAQPLVQIIINIVSDKKAEDLVQTIPIPDDITRPIIRPDGEGELIEDIFTRPIIRPEVKPNFPGEEPIMSLPAEMPGQDLTRPSVDDSNILNSFDGNSDRPASDLIR